MGNNSTKQKNNSHKTLNQSRSIGSKKDRCGKLQNTFSQFLSIDEEVLNKLPTWVQKLHEIIEKMEEESNV